jgi:hypothetical protein
MKKSGSIKKKEGSSLHVRDLSYLTNGRDNAYNINDVTNEAWYMLCNSIVCY